MKDYIQLFSLIDLISVQLGTKAYLWGGWIPDIYSGKLLRDHFDAEYLILHLYQHLDRIQKIFDILGWETRVVENGDLVIKKDKYKVHFGHLEIQDKTAEWFHNGKLGKIVFPASWLNEDEVTLENHTLHAVKPEFQLVLKLHPEFMNPAWKLMTREKDMLDIAVLKSLILEKDISVLEGQMRSEEM